MDVVVVGELNPDLILSGIPGAPQLGTEQLARSFVITLGSSSAICAVALAKLGLEVGLVSKVGHDQTGGFCLEFLRRHGVDTTNVAVDPAIATGVTVSLSYPADRLLVTYPGSIGELSLDDVDLDYVAKARHLHLSSYYLQRRLRKDIAALFQAAKSMGLSVSLDTGWDPSGEWGKDVLPCLDHVDVFLPNESELCRITRRNTWQEGISALRGRMPSPAIVAVKLGSSGAAANRSGETLRAEPHPITPVDSTGAGDSFDAGFIYGFVKKKSLAESLALANACGALSVSKTGGTGGFDRFSDVERLMDGSPARVYPDQA